MQALRIEQLTKEPRTLGQINPKGLKQFAKRKCVTCRKPIMKHYVLNFHTQDMATRWYCHRDGTQSSGGMSNGY